MAIADTLDATIAALQSGPKKIPVSAAIQNLDTWHSELSSVGDAQVKSVVTDLGKLKSLLQSSSPDDAAITSLLEKLSTATTSAASGQSGETGQKLKQLGQLLGHSS